MNLEEKVLSDKCGNVAVSIKPRKKMPRKTMPRKTIVYAVRDFPPNCGRAKRLPLQAQENSKLEGSVDDLKSTNMTEEVGSESKTKDELLSTFSKDGSVDAGLSDPSKTEVCGNTRLPNEVQQIASNVPPPRIRVPAKRTYPPGCGRNAPRLDHQVAPKFSELKTSGPDQTIDEEEETEESGNVCSTDGDKNMFLSRSISSGMKGNMQEKDDNKCLDGKLSEHITQEALASSESPGNLIIVQGLMAASNCPGTTSKRDKSGHENNVSSTDGEKNMFLSRSISFGMKGNMQENDNNNCLDGKFSEHITQEALASSESPGNLIIVQGLMAASNCPWTNSIRGKYVLNKH